MLPSAWSRVTLFAEYDGLFITNGPGNPDMLAKTIGTVKALLEGKEAKPVFGICMGHQVARIVVEFDWGGGVVEFDWGGGVVEFDWGGGVVEFDWGRWCGGV